MFSAPWRLAGVGLSGGHAVFLSAVYKSRKKKIVFSSCQDPMAVRRVLCWSLQGPGSHASPPFDGCAGCGQPRGSLPRPGGLASLEMYICSTSGPNCCAGKELSMLVSRQPAFWDWRGGRRPGRAGQPRLRRKCHWELSVFFCFFLQRALFVPSLSPADPNRNPPRLSAPPQHWVWKVCQRLPSGALDSQGACAPFPSSLEERGKEAGREPGSCPRGTALMRFLPRSARSQARIYSLSSEAGLTDKAPSNLSLSRPAGGDFSELHPPNCEMGAIARSEDGGEWAQMKPGAGRLQPESLQPKFGWKSRNRGTCWGRREGRGLWFGWGPCLPLGEVGP